MLGIAATDDALNSWRALDMPLLEADLVDRWRVLLVAQRIQSDVLAGPAAYIANALDLYQSSFKIMALACCPSLRTVERNTKALNTHVSRMWQRVVAGVGKAVSVPQC